MSSERNSDKEPVYYWGPKPKESDVKVGPRRTERPASPHWSLLPNDMLFISLQMFLYLNLMPTAKNDTVEEPEGHGRICSVSHPTSTVHLCNSPTHPGAQSNELS